MSAPAARGQQLLCVVVYVGCSAYAAVPEKLVPETIRQNIVHTNRLSGTLHGSLGEEKPRHYLPN